MDLKVIDRACTEIESVVYGLSHACIKVDGLCSTLSAFLFVNFSARGENTAGDWPRGVEGTSAAA
jgi:hypothetical protein